MSIKDIIRRAVEPTIDAVELPEKIREYYTKHGYQWQDTNIIAVRNCDKVNDNTFSDCISIVTDAEVVSYLCTTVPGTTWTQGTLKKYNMSTVGSYCLGFYPKLWAFGAHHGRALRQVGKCDWYIDTDLDKKQGAGEKVFRGQYCAMNVHRKPQDGAKTVDLASAGCIVPKYHADLDDFLNRLGWRTATPPKKTFNGLITDTDSFPFARDLMRLIIMR